MTDRVARLRQRSVSARPSISVERARLLTQFYSTDATASPVLRRAKALAYLMRNKAIYIGDDELIVGERGPEPAATPTYPELTCHSLEDLQILNSREKTSYSVSPEVMEEYKNVIIPFWSGRSMRDLIFQEMTPEWKDAYDAGIFTEFMELRAPGHTVADGKIYALGMKGLRRRIAEALEELDFINDPEAQARSEQLRAMDICAEAICAYARRHAELAYLKAASERDPQRRKELVRIAEVCSHVPENPPRNLWEALQAYWFCHLGSSSS